MTSKGVILCGGPHKGTRMRPLSLDIPKPLFPIAGRPMIWHGIQALSKVEGLKEVLLIASYEDNVFSGFVKSVQADFPGLSVRYLREYQELGTAGGLYHFRDTILKGSPSQIYVLHADICSAFPLSSLKTFHEHHRGVGTLMAVSVPRSDAHKYGCIVLNPTTSQALHYVEKPETFISETINAGVYLFDRSIFEEIRIAMDAKTGRKERALEGLEGGLEGEEGDDKLRLEQDVIAPLAAGGKLYAFVTKDFWRQIKSAGSAVPANALLLSSYKTTNPTLLRRRSPTLASPPTKTPTAATKAEIVEPCYIDPTSELDPTCKIGPNVSIGANVRVGFGARVKDAIVLDGATLEANSVVVWGIVGEESKVGQWARVEGCEEKEGKKMNIAILAKDVSIAKESLVRSCIVLPHKSLSGSFSHEVLL